MLGERLRRAVTVLHLCGMSLLVLPTTMGLAADFLRVAWDRSYGDDRLWNDYSAMAIGKDGALLIAGSARTAPGDSVAKPGRLLLWQLNNAGEATSEIEIRKPTAAPNVPEAQTVTAAIKDVLALDSGDALLLVDFEGARPSLVKIDTTGKQVFAKQLTGPERAVTLFKILATSDGAFVLLGHQSLDAFVMKLDAAGDVLWERKYDRGKMDLFVDGIPIEDGAFVLVGNSGTYDVLRGGPSVVSVGQYDADGAMSAEVTFDGRYGRVAQAPGGGYAVVYDKDHSENQDVRVRRLGSDLKEIWETQLLVAMPSFMDFRIGTLRGGGFVVAGGRDGKLYVNRIDSRGGSTGVFQEDATNPIIRLGTYGLLTVGSELIIASSTIDPREKANARQRIGVVRLRS